MSKVKPVGWDVREKEAPRTTPKVFMLSKVELHFIWMGSQEFGFGHF